MTNNIAIVNIINKLETINSAPCKKTLQKIIYLIENKGVNLGCNYGIHFYGPYSSDLDFAVRELSDDGILNIQYTLTEHRISVSKETNFLEKHTFDNSTVDDVINEFSKDSPSELELIATTLYVYLQVKDIDKVMPGVIKIKGSKYSTTRIQSTIDRLQRTGYIVA